MFIKPLLNPFTKNKYIYIYMYISKKFIPFVQHQFIRIIKMLKEIRVWNKNINVNIKSI
jgi:hypothetical protein